MQPLPTPYDIAALPAFPYTPSRSVWLAVLCLALAALVILWIVRYRKRGHGAPHSSLAELLKRASTDAKQIGSAGTGVSDRDLLRLAQIAKRTATIGESRDIAALSGNEALSLAKTSEPPLAQLLVALSEVETLRYARPTDADRATTASHLLHALEAYCEERAKSRQTPETEQQ